MRGRRARAASSPAGPPSPVGVDRAHRCAPTHRERVDAPWPNPAEQGPRGARGGYVMLGGAYRGDGRGAVHGLGVSRQKVKCVNAGGVDRLLEACHGHAHRVAHACAQRHEQVEQVDAPVPAGFHMQSRTEGRNNDTHERTPCTRRRRRSASPPRTVATQSGVRSRAARASVGRRGSSCCGQSASRPRWQTRGCPGRRQCSSPPPPKSAA